MTHWYACVTGSACKTFRTCFKKKRSVAIKNNKLELLYAT